MNRKKFTRGAVYASENITVEVPLANTNEFVPDETDSFLEEIQTQIPTSSSPIKLSPVHLSEKLDESDELFLECDLSDGDLMASSSDQKSSYSLPLVSQNEFNSNDIIDLEEIESTLDADKEKLSTLRSLVVDLGHNVMVYGIGSKRMFLDSFSSRTLKDFPVVTISAYRKIQSLERVILNNIAQSLSCPSSDPNDIWKYCQTKLSFSSSTFPPSPPKLIIVVHSADSEENVKTESFSTTQYPFFANGNLIPFLQKLAFNFPSIRFVFSVDKTDWYSVEYNPFLFFYFPLNTFIPFLVEKSFYTFSRKESIDFYAIATNAIKTISETQRDCLSLFLDIVLRQLKGAKANARLEKTKRITIRDTFPNVSTLDDLAKQSCSRKTAEFRESVIICAANENLGGNPFQVTQETLRKGCHLLFFSSPSVVIENLTDLARQKLLEYNTDENGTKILSSVLNEVGAEKLRSELQKIEDEGKEVDLVL